MILIIIGFILLAMGAIIVVTGKIPFVKRYANIKEDKIKLYCRIQGCLIIVETLIFIIWNFSEFRPLLFLFLLISVPIVGHIIITRLKIYK